MLCDSCPFQLTQACFGAHHVAQLGGAHCALERNTPRCWAGGFPGTPVRSGRLGCCSSLLFCCWSAAQPAHYWKWSVDVFNCYVWIAHFSLQFCCFCCTDPRALSLDAYVYNLCVFPSVILKCPSFPPVTFFFFLVLKSIWSVTSFLVFDGDVTHLFAPLHFQLTSVLEPPTCLLQAAHSWVLLFMQPNSVCLLNEFLIYTL